MKIERITKKTLLAVIKDEKLSIHFEDKAMAIREPGVIGICKTAAGNHMVYCVNANGKLFNTSVHTNRREANGRCLERIRKAMA